jgi:hypothetical protein
MAIRAQFVQAQLIAFVLLAGCCQLFSSSATAEAPVALCTPVVTKPVVVAGPGQRLQAGQRSQPPLTDIFAWPDTPLGVIKTASGYEFFGSDGGYHAQQTWEGKLVGNNKAGSIVVTTGTLDKPLGSGDPQNVSITRNPDPAVNANYPSYGYMGGGPVYQIPQGMPHAGALLATYHAELPKDALYAALGLAASSDNGQHWTDLGEIIRLNQAYALGLDGFEIGDGPLVLSPDGKYFYLYFPDWIANGTLHTTRPTGASTTTHVSVARAPVSSVLQAAFGPANPSTADAPIASYHPHTVAFEKFYEGNWDLQPGLGGASADLSPKSAYSGYLDIHFNSALKRYVMIISNDTNFAYAESVDGLTWTVPTLLGNFDTIAAYPTAIGLGEDPHILGKSYYIYFTHLPTDDTGWTNGSLQRVTVTCK